MIDLKNYAGNVVTRMELSACKPRRALHLWSGYLLAVAVLMALALWMSQPERHATSYSQLPSADETMIRLELRDRQLEREARK